jgi:hypothetical protein
MSGRRVLLFVDNAPPHQLGDVELKNTTVHFFPPNTTSVLQPMDAGVIASLKRHYRRRHIRYMFSLLALRHSKLNSALCLADG